MTKMLIFQELIQLEILQMITLKLQTPKIQVLIKLKIVLELKHLVFK